MKTIRIEIQGVLEEQWKEWFEDLVFSYEKSNTILSGPCEDQAAFHGILNRIRDLNLVLVSISFDTKTITQSLTKTKKS
jgi:hypothetical protein